MIPLYLSNKLYIMPTPKSSHIPRATIERLSVYLQVLENVVRENIEVISSEQLARECNSNASQIRKDLTYFGEFGVRGVGYNVKRLIDSITESLGIDRVWNCVLVGVGNLGRALLNHREFDKRRFHIVGAFDCDPFLIGEKIGGYKVIDTRGLKEQIADLNVKIGIISTPPERAQRAANFLIDAGIKGILNYAPARIFVPEGIYVEYVDFLHHLYSLAFHIAVEKDT